MLYRDQQKFDSLLYELNKDWQKLAPEIMLYKDSALDCSKVSTDIRNYYFKNKTIDKTTLPQLVNVSK